MRATFAILSLPLLSLAACGGGGAGTQSLGSIAPPISGGTVAGGGVVAVTPTPTPTSTPTSFLDVKTTTTFDAIGGLHAIDVDENGRSLYTGNASTVGTPSGTISFNPRDGIFTVALADTAANVTRSVTYQDPAHRTAGGMLQAEIPEFPFYNYLEAASDDNLSDTFFYKRPGNTASYVTLAGFAHRSKLDTTTGAFHSERGVMVFGSKSTLLQVPSTGSGRFDGDFLATMVAGSSGPAGMPLQWISGNSSVDVDFGKSSLTLGLTGTVSKTYVNDTPVNDFFTDIPTGSVFTANGTASLTGSRTGFAGKFLSAYFTSGATRTNIDFAPISAASSVAGASSIDGAFYGPNAENLGGNFRITGGVPNQRIDILGAFTGAKK